MSDEVDLSEIRVLVIDDEEFSRSIVKQLPESMGVGSIAEAVDGSDAFTKIAMVAPDMVLVDIMMRPMNGLQFLKALRSGFVGERSDLPAIVMTGSGEQTVFGTAMELDCDAFLKKPVKRGALEERIRRAFNQPAERKVLSAYQAVEIPDIEIVVSEGPPTPPPSPFPTVPTAPTSRIREVPIEEIEPGMVVAREVQTEDGNILLAEGVKIDDARLNRLRDISEIINLPSIWVRG